MSIVASRTDRLVRMKHLKGFTLFELLVVVAIIGILSAILLPALARTKARAQGAFCLSNTKQLIVAWTIYADDHSGRLAYNLGANASGIAVQLGSPPAMSANWANNVLNWELSPDNTNAAALVDSGIGPYLSKVANVYRCPSDNVLSSIQQEASWNARVRSYSMNAMVGDAGAFSQAGTNVNNPGYVQFFKYTGIPRPSDIFVFLDEHPDSITDGYFVNKVYRSEWRRLPASYHNGAACFSFADGHAEIHAWRYAATKPPSRPYAAALPIQIPKDQSADFDWVVSRMSVEQNDEDERPQHVYHHQN
jgi:prepilin-type N-terminal cleavage/methylation domain-containing protein/prepilin-type processing-associated H-X9-DG protein